MKLEDFLAKLENVKPAGESSYMCRCPAHEDGKASLSVKGAGGKILVRCFAGCSTDSVVGAMDLRMGDLFSEPGAKEAVKRIVATYDYRDEMGDLLFQTVRYDPKDFRQRHKDASGQWVWNLKGVRLVPYRLPECLEAINSGKTLFVSEGEKDCDILWKNGVPATCNPLGGGTIKNPKWREEFTECLRSVKSVTILADNDEKPNRQGEWVGKEHAITIAESFTKICPEVRVGILPNNNGHRTKDAYDWFTQGGTAEKLMEFHSRLRLFNRAQPFPNPSVLHDTWTVKDLIAFDPTADANAVIGIKDGKTTRYLCKGYGSWFIGQSGLGKSSLAIQEAVLWCLGRPFFGVTPIRPLRVLFVESENDEGDMAEPIQGILDSIAITPAEVDLISETLKISRCRGLTGKDFFDWLEKEVVAHHADVVYVDPLLRFAGIEISRTEQCTMLLNQWIDPMLARTGVIMKGIHHTGKPKDDQKSKKGMTIYDYMYSGIGSSELVNWARAVSVVMPISDGLFELKLAKRGRRAWATHPNGDPTTSLFLKHHPERIFWEQTDPPEMDEHGGKPGGRPSQVDVISRHNLHSFCAECKPEGEGLNEIAKRLERWLAREKIDASLSTCKRAIPALVANAKLHKTDDSTYIKGPEA